MSTDAKTTQGSLRRPLPNSYWVEPGRLLAGEHPSGASWSATVERLQALLAAGVTLFIDLTEEDELASYDKLFDYVSLERPLKHLRMPISDHGVPKSPDTIREALAAIDAHLNDGGIAYVHCRAGIGRTGTAVGCYLVQRGYTGDEALEKLNALWCESERSRTWPSVPETDAQAAYIRNWSKHIAVTPPQTQASARVVETPITTASRFEGLLIGMAIGDAIGAATATQIGESQELPAGGPLNVPNGAWLADTAMTLSLSQSLFAVGGNDAQDQMQRYLAWQRDGVCSSTGVALGFPDEVRRALAQWQWSRKPMAGSHDPNNLDAHPLARTAAVAMYFASDPVLTLHEAGEAARPTLQSPIVLDACRAYAALLSAALQGADKEALLAFKHTPAAKALRSRRLKQEIAHLIDGAWREWALRDGADVLTTLSVVLAAFDRSDFFGQGAVSVIDGRTNAATVGAVYGSIAGAYYGVGGIPDRWLGSVLYARELSELAQRFAARQ
jgi:ADP-ribosyl-[dinitrogen reductase] hydrolase